MFYWSRNIILGLLSFVACLGFALGWTEPKFLKIEEATVAESENLNTESTEAETDVVEAENTSINLASGTPWQAPNYLGQEGALGWHENIFNVPKGLETRVNFWKDIYTKYSTDMGVLHDSEHVSVVYSVIDFRSIMNNPNLSDREKSRARRKLVDAKKSEIRERLARLEKLKQQPGEAPQGLAAEDLHVWGMFSSIDEERKFEKAKHRKRLRFQLGQSDRFLQGIFYSGRYLPAMESIFRERGLPIELTRLPFVESSFNVKARSRVGASGIWQFMRYTGRRFMRINYAVDERNDPIRSAEAAARLFRLNYEMLGHWPLAITGYNHGPSGVQKVVRKFQTNDIVELVDERFGRFGFASANFYACFLAALEVEKNAKAYFGDKIFWDSPVDAKDIRLTQAVSKKLLLKWFAGDENKAKDLNPHLLKSFWLGYASAGAKDFIRVPAAMYEIALEDLKNSRGVQLIASREPSATGSQNEVEYYMINQGETLSEIATQHGVSLSVLTELNGIDNPRAIRAGQKIMIPPLSNKK